MAVTALDNASRFASFSDAAVFGRVSDALNAYAERLLADAPVVDEQIEEANKTGLVARFQAFMARRATAAELNKLSDATLADIGIVRADINELVIR